MNKVPSKVIRKSGSERGQSIAEYTMMLTLLLIMVSLMQALGLHLEQMFRWIVVNIH